VTIKDLNAAQTRRYFTMTAVNSFLKLSNEQLWNAP